MKLWIGLLLPFLIACSVAAGAPTGTPTLTVAQDMERARNLLLIDTCRDWVNIYWGPEDADRMAIWEVNGVPPTFTVTGTYMYDMTKTTYSENIRSEVAVRETAHCNLKRVTGGWEGSGGVQRESDLPISEFQQWMQNYPLAKGHSLR